MYICYWNSICDIFFINISLFHVNGSSLYRLIINPLILGNLGKEYRNRKGYFSLNVQAICDADMQFMNVVACPGSSHDATIFNNSVLRGDMFYRYISFYKNFSLQKQANFVKIFSYF